MKRISHLVAMAVAIITLSACSEESESINFVGKWNVTEFFFTGIYDDGDSIPHSFYSYASYKPIEKQQRVMSFNSDGTGLDDYSLLGTSVSFTWKFQEDRLTLRATDQLYDNLPFDVHRRWNKVILSYEDSKTHCEIIIKKSDNS